MTRPTYIVGINAFHGDASAVLLRDGQLLAAVEEERFTRVKHDSTFPRDAVRACLAIGGIRGSDVAHVAFSRDPRAHLMRKAWFVLTRRPHVGLILDRLRNAASVRDVRASLAAALGLTADGLPALHYVEHHPAHLASAFFVSPFRDAAVCAIDGFGDFVSTSTAVGHDRQIEVLDRVYFPHSLGILYTAVTQHLGFLGYGDEFKVMGLAPYGAPVFAPHLRQLVQLENGGRFRLNLEYFRHWSDQVAMEWTGGAPHVERLYTPALEALLGPARLPNAPLERRHEDMARSLQAVYEECLFHVLNGLWERTRVPSLCLAGGCAMNSVANGKIRGATPFRELFIQPAAADNGTALGAAYDVWHRHLGGARGFVMEHASWGTEYSDVAVAALLRGRENGWTYEVVEHDDRTLAPAVARLIVEGNVVGWFQGRMEWGARALGNRSILADPRRADMRDVINTRIKQRERFRPFAPSIVEEALHDYFVGGVPDRFMQQVYPVRPEKRSVLPAITHVDGSGRLQTVSADSNPRYYALLKAFEALTGVPVLLNTSFNENEPIVDTPAQAMDCFLRTRMDAIVIGNTIVVRRPATG